MELLEVAQFQSLPVNITRCPSKYDQFAFSFRPLLFLEASAFQGLMAASLKKSGQGFTCGLILFPASLAPGARRGGGGQRMSSEVRKHWPKQSSQPDTFLTTGLVCCFLPSFFPFCFSNSLNDCCGFRLFSLTAAWLCYLCVSTEDMALHFVHGVHPVRHGAEMEPPEHHLILSQSP